jgi:uncharacterized protein with PIN domain
MHGSLARKLRIFGFDTLYFRDGKDSDLEKIARKEGRVILTSDKSLFERSRRLRRGAILIKGRTDRARLLSLFRQTGPEVVDFIGTAGASRCAVCNGELEHIKKDEAALTGAPAKVLVRHRLFYRCRSCSRLYWRGRHWDRLRMLSSSVKTKALT